MNLKAEDITKEELKQIQKQREIKQRQEKEKEYKKDKKLIEFSKKIMFCVISVSFIVIIFTMYIMIKLANTTYLDILIIETFKFSKVAVIFYYSKACVENFQKIKNANQLKMQEYIQNIKDEENI